MDSAWPADLLSNRSAVSVGTLRRGLSRPDCRVPSGVIPPDLGGLGNLKLLEDLGLEGNDLSGCVPTELPEIWVDESGLKRC